MIRIILASAISLTFAQNCPCEPPPPAPCKPCPPVCFERGYPNENNCFPSAYNEPANFELDPCAWDVWLDASFTYWDAEQEGMDLAVSSTELATILLAPIDGKFLMQDRGFKPGFKVGIGINLNHDHWSGLLEYTWFRSNTSTSKVAPADARGGTPVWILSNWFNRQDNIAAESISSDWRLKLDLLDAELTRPYYQGTHLIVAPFGGLRAQWIRQKLNLFADIFTSSLSAPPLSATSSNRSNSWAIGPRLGSLVKWHFGYGFRFEGDVAGSILFTRYTSVKHRQTPTTTLITATDVGGEFDHYNCLRAGSELSLGLGWGRYFGCGRTHFDLLASYDFQIFWNQNIMRQLADTFADGTGHSPSNLYLQGLTVRAELDF